MTMDIGPDAGPLVWQVSGGSYAQQSARGDGMPITLKDDFLSMSWPGLQWHIVWPCGMKHTFDTHVCSTYHHPGDVEVVWIWK